MLWDDLTPEEQRRLVERDRAAFASPPAPVEPSPIERLRRGIGAVRCDGAYPVEHDLAAVEEAFRRLQEENERLTKQDEWLRHEIAEMGKWVNSDGTAITYQTLGQYRSELTRWVNGILDDSAPLRGSEPSARPATQEET